MSSSIVLTSALLAFLMSLTILVDAIKIFMWYTKITSTPGKIGQVRARLPSEPY